MTSQQFTATVAAAARGGVLIPVPFNPDTVWGTKRRHHIAGTVNHMGVRGVVEPDDLAEDIAAALAAHPQAAAFFDSLAQFYRRPYLRWIDATKRHPEKRVQRIAEMIRLLEAGQKQRPQQ